MTQSRDESGLDSVQEIEFFDDNRAPHGRAVKHSGDDNTVVKFDIKFCVRTSSKIQHNNK